MKIRFLNPLIPPIGKHLISLLGHSLHLTVEDPDGILAHPNRPPVIFAFWHNRLLMTPFFFRKHCPNRRLVAMISRSRDGELISGIIRAFGLEASRGSSSKKGSLAFRELIRLIQEEKCDLAITPDGPRGPRYHLQPGVIHLSQMTGRPVVAVNYLLEEMKELQSWDRFRIPAPFTRCTLKIASPLLIPPHLTEKEIAKWAHKLSLALGE